MCYNFQKNDKKIFLPKACANFDRFFSVESRMLSSREIYFPLCGNFQTTESAKNLKLFKKKNFFANKVTSN
jgi:hypothetical protein